MGLGEFSVILIFPCLENKILTCLTYSFAESSSPLPFNSAHTRNSFFSSSVYFFLLSVVVGLLLVKVQFSTNKFWYPLLLLACTMLLKKSSFQNLWGNGSTFCRNTLLSKIQSINKKYSQNRVFCLFVCFERYRVNIVLNPTNKSKSNFFFYIMWWYYSFRFWSFWKLKQNICQVIWEKSLVRNFSRKSIDIFAFVCDSIG